MGGKHLGAGELLSTQSKIFSKKRIPSVFIKRQRQIGSKAQSKCKGEHKIGARFQPSHHEKRRRQAIAINIPKSGFGKKEHQLKIDNKKASTKAQGIIGKENSTILEHHFQLQLHC